MVEKRGAVHRASSKEQRCHAGVFKIFPQNSNKFHLWFQISKINHFSPAVYGLRSTREMRVQKIMLISCSDILVLINK